MAIRTLRTAIPRSRSTGPSAATSVRRTALCASPAPLQPTAPPAPAAMEPSAESSSMASRFSKGASSISAWATPSWSQPMLVQRSTSSLMPARAITTSATPPSLPPSFARPLAPLWWQTPLATGPMKALKVRTTGRMVTLTPRPVASLPQASSSHSRVVQDLTAPPTTGMAKRGSGLMANRRSTPSRRSKHVRASSPQAASRVTNIA